MNAVSPESVMYTPPEILMAENQVYTAESHIQTFGVLLFYVFASVPFMPPGAEAIGLTSEPVTTGYRSELPATMKG
jgi:hypothetical protein